MYSSKQSNWILGCGIIVAIILIVTSILLSQAPDNSGTSVENGNIPEVGQTLKTINKGLGWISSVIKTLN